MQAFTRAIQCLPNARTLDAEAFFAEPGGFLKLAAAQLGVPMTDEDIENTVEGPLFATYSKNPQQQFNNKMRLDRRSELEQTLARELEQARDWVERRGGEQLAIRTVAATALGLAV
jgi:hypothetical protein